MLYWLAPPINLTFKDNLVISVCILYLHLGNFRTLKIKNPVASGRGGRRDPLLYLAPPLTKS